MILNEKHQIIKACCTKGMDNLAEVNDELRLLSKRLENLNSPVNLLIIQIEILMPFCAAYSCLDKQHPYSGESTEDNMYVKSIEPSPEIAHHYFIALQVQLIYCDNPSKMSRILIDTFGGIALGDIFHAEQLICHTLRPTTLRRVAFSAVPTFCPGSCN